MKVNKLSILGLGTMLALSAASCSDDITGENTKVDFNDVETNYLTINIVAGPTTTRAGENVYDDGSEGTYQDGNATENYVKSVRFYFFNATGNAANVVNSSGIKQSYLDWDPKEDEQALTPNDHNVEKVLGAKLIINTQNGDALPASVVAVINPTSSIKGENISSIDKLNQVTGNYAITSENEKEGFLMSNSIYVNETGKEMEEVSVSNHIFNTSQQAENNPVTIYVERVNAKVTLDVNESMKPVPGKVGIYDTTIKNETGATEQPIYVQFLGWNVTAVTNNTNLMKDINPGWTNQNVFGNASIAWNSPTRFRSFWAMNPSEVDYVYGPFNTKDTPTAANAITDFTNGYAYTLENASPFSNTISLSKTVNPTQVIVAAQLLDENFKPLTIAEYGNQQFTLDGLKKEIAGLSNVYKVTPNGDTSYRYTKIDENDITFVTAMTLDPSLDTWTKTGRYYVFAQLKDTDKVDYSIGENTEINNVEANKSLVALGHAKIWSEGYTYWYFDISHLGVENSVGQYGVVRNHIYAATINSVKGLGTPVYNPDETIYPEKPSDDDSYIAAKINILNWRLIRQGVDFAW